MNQLALFLLWSSFCPFVLAQAPAPSPSVAPSASPSVTPEVVVPGEDSAPAPSPTPQPSATPLSLRSVIDSMSGAEVQEAMSALRGSYLDPSALGEGEMAKATLQGLLDRLDHGVTLTQPVGPEESQASPFRAEVLDDQVGYLRLGALAKGNIEQMDAGLRNFRDKGLKAVVLDLRATGESSDFELAAEVARRFCPKGKMLFALKKPSARQERMFTSNQDPAFSGLVVVTVDNETAGAGEVIPAVLRQSANAMVVGGRTAGRAAEYENVRLRNGKVLRVAVGEVTVPGAAVIFPGGVTPDLVVEVPAAVKHEVMKQGLELGVSQMVFETERPRMNEASLVAGTNPELDSLQNSQRTKPGKPVQRDAVLQRAMDLVTTIDIYETKTPRAARKTREE
jgi:hypothetical protein